METIAWVPWTSPLVGAAIALPLFAAAAPRASAATTARAARLLRRGAITLLLACGLTSVAVLYAFLREPREDAYLGPFLVLIAGGWWGLWAGIATAPWLGQRSDLDMTSAVRTTRAGLKLVFALGLGGVGAVVGSIVFLAAFFGAVAMQ